VAPRSTRSHLVFVLGGASSGKSEVALRLASKGIGKKAPRAFVATGEGLDEEMAMKIARHRQSRSSDWITAEVPFELTAWLKDQGQAYRTILIDCLTMWLSNRWREGSKEQEILQDARTFLTALRRLKARTVMVSNELGMGLVPIEGDSRRFREVAGALNRLVAQEADEAYFVVSGIPLRLK
jgi:adenosylcobinamide kinase / adenosylcobinamide-phosphate guanylyltransferase